MNQQRANTTETNSDLFYNDTFLNLNPQYLVQNPSSSTVWDSSRIELTIEHKEWTSVCLCCSNKHLYW